MLDNELWSAGTLCVVKTEIKDISGGFRFEAGPLAPLQ